MNRLSFYLVAQKNGFVLPMANKRGNQKVNIDNSSGKH